MSLSVSTLTLPAVTTDRPQPHIVALKDGRALLFTLEPVEDELEPFNIYARPFDGQRWGEPVEIGKGVSSQLLVRQNTSGQVLVAWSAMSSSVRFTVYDAGTKAWGRRGGAGRGFTYLFDADIDDRDNVAVVAVARRPEDADKGLVTWGLQTPGSRLREQELKDVRKPTLRERRPVAVRVALQAGRAALLVARLDYHQVEPSFASYYEVLDPTAYESVQGADATSLPPLVPFERLAEQGLRGGLVNEQHQMLLGWRLLSDGRLGVFWGGTPLDLDSEPSSQSLEPRAWGGAGRNAFQIARLKVEPGALTTRKQWTSTPSTGLLATRGDRLGAAWVDESGLRYAELDGTHWSPVRTVLTTPEDTDLATTQLFSNPSGDIVAAWTSGSGVYEMHLARDHAIWSPPRLVVATAPGKRDRIGGWHDFEIVSLVSASADPDGKRLHVIWSSRTEQKRELRVGSSAL